MNIEIVDNDKKQITPRTRQYVEVLLLIGFKQARISKTGAIEFTVLGVNVQYNVGPYTKCMVWVEGDENDDLWVGSIRNIKQLTDKIAELAS